MTFTILTEYKGFAIMGEYPSYELAQAAIEKSWEKPFTLAPGQNSRPACHIVTGDKQGWEETIKAATADSIADTVGDNAKYAYRQSREYLDFLGTPEGNRCIKSFMDSFPIE